MGAQQVTVIHSRTAATLSGADPDFAAKVFREALKRRRLPQPVAEHRFALPRRWRFDWAWPDQHVALEIEGGIWLKGGGRHNRGAGFLNDLCKYNRATALGWRVFRCTPQTLCSSVTLDLLAGALQP